MNDKAVGLKPEPSAAFRWLVLLVISFAMFGNYYIYDSISPLADILAKQLNFTDGDIGLLQGIYSLPNIFMVLIGGFIIDRIGTKKSALLFASFCMAGALVTVATSSLYVMAAGRLIFGLGAESLIVAVTTTVARWFKGKELSFAFGLNLTIARLGSFAALNSPSWGKSFYDHWDTPLWISVGAGVIMLLSVFIYIILDKAAERKYAMKQEGEQDKIDLNNVLKFGKSFWFITLLCVTFYSAMFPFQTFAVKFFMQNHFTDIPEGLARSMGGFLSSLLTLSAMFLTPLFGLLSDKIGKRSLLMMFGSLLIIPVYLTMNYTKSEAIIPEETLKAINANHEIVKDYANNQNALINNYNKSLDDIKASISNYNEHSSGLKLDAAFQLDTNLYNSKQMDEPKLLSISLNNVQKLVDSLQLNDELSVSSELGKIKISEKGESTFFAGFLQVIAYFFTMIKVLFLYYPHLLIPMVIMGVAFSLVPAVMWPSVALVVDESRLGTAYGLMTMVQNIGLTAFNFFIGWAKDLSGDYTAGMWIFSTLGFFGLFFAFLLRRSEKGPNGHGLELPKGSKS